MADPNHTEIFSLGPAAWNTWRAAHPQIRPDLSAFDFGTVKLRYEIDPSGNRHEGLFWQINLSGSNLTGAVMSKREFHFADLSGSDLSGAMLNDVLMKGCDLRRSSLRGANLKGARLVMSDLSGADLTGAFVFGVSPWDVDLEGAVQHELVLNPPTAPRISVDNIQVAQFVYSLLENKNIPKMVDSVADRVVLLLGRFAPEQKGTLDALREALRHENYVPVMFDFDKPESRNTLETVTLLARMARFVLADLTAAKSVLQEVGAIVPSLPSVPVQPIIRVGEAEPGMIDSFEAFPSFLTPFVYQDTEHLLKSLPKLVATAERKANALQRKRKWRERLRRWLG